MKHFSLRFLIIVSLCLFISSFSHAGEKQSLSYLYSISGTKTISGQHNDRKKTNPGPSYFTQKINDVTGRYPGLWGGDFEYDRFRIEGRSTMMDEAIVQWEKGALISLMWHACPPTVGEPCGWSQDVQGYLSDSELNDLITNGGDLNTKWKSMMDEIAVYLKDLEDEGVEVLFRPLHEMNQGNFWWGGRPGANGTRRLYQITHDYFTKVKGLTNLIWVWDMQDFDSLTEDLQNYNPGSAYWDVAALDIYSGFSNWKYQAMVDISGGKPIAIGETASLPSPERLATENRWTFFMGWAQLVFDTNSNDTLQTVYKADRVITQNEMPGWSGAPIEKNIAEGRPVSVSSTEPGPNAGSHAVDGNSQTRWSSEYSDPQWITIDLGAAYDIHRVKIHWEVAFGKTYEIEISDDASSWTSIYNTQNSDGGVDDLNN